MNKATVWYNIFFDEEEDVVETFQGDLDCGVLDGTVVIREVSGKVDKYMSTTIIPLGRIKQVKFEQNIKEDSDEAAGELQVVGGKDE